MHARKEALRRIEKARVTAAWLLDLGDLALDSLPNNLGQLSALRVLALGQISPIETDGVLQWYHSQGRRRQRFTNIEVLQNLTRLQALDLNGCESVTKLDPLRDLKGLHWLDLEGCKDVTELDSLRNLTELHSLSLGLCEGITNLDALCNLTRLQKLKLAKCKGITKLGPLSNLTELHSLNLAGCEGITNLDALSSLTSLYKLDLAFCKGITNLDALGSLISLHKLDLTYCNNIMKFDALSKLTDLQELLMDGCNAFADLEVLSKLTDLHSLELAECKGIANLNPLTNLTALRWLDLAECEGITNLNALSKLTGLKELRLEACNGITSLDALSKLPALQFLRLDDCNGITSLNALSKLDSLESLNLSGCKGITNLDALSNLTGLKELNLENCNGIANLTTLSNLTGLHDLNMAGRKDITNLDALSTLTHLRSLNLSGCKGITNLDALSNLNSLQSLNLSGCKGITNLDALSNLNSLQSLNLSGCKGITNLDALSNLNSLQSLDLTECSAITNLDPLRNHAEIGWLNLDGCEGITEITALSNLTNLHTLDLTKCTRVKEFAPVPDLLPHLKSLILKGCHFNDLDDALCEYSSGKNVVDAVRTHCTEGAAYGWEHDKELKVFVLGNGGVGKTQLCRKLLRKAFKDVGPTHGVKLSHINVSCASQPKRIRLNLWDFGGQDIYHGSHALFLQGSAIFVLMWTPQTEGGEYQMGKATIRHRSLAYWLDYVLSVAGSKYPILIVQGRCDRDEDRRPLPVQLPDNFPTNRCLVFSAVKDEKETKLNDLRTSLGQAAADILKLREGVMIPRGRLRLARKLRRMLENNEKRLENNLRPRRILTQERFRLLCEANGMIDDWHEALLFLHNRGTLFWRPELFKGRIILDQSWALDTIYTLIDPNGSFSQLYNMGRFTRNQLWSAVMKKPAKAEQRTILGMMESCGICFRVCRIKSDDSELEYEYIAPELLPIRQLSEIQKQVVGPQPIDAARGEVRYRFLHEGIIRNLLSWIGRKVGDNAVYWRFGCWLREPDTEVQVIIDSHWDDNAVHPAQGKITLEIWGRHFAPLLESLLSKLKTLSPLQMPEVSLTNVADRDLAGSRLGDNGTAETIKTKYKIGIGLDRTYIPTPGRLVKGAATYRWRGMYVLVKILLGLRQGDVVSQRPLSQTLSKITSDSYSAGTAGNYMVSLEEIAKESVFRRPGNTNKGDPTTLMHGSTMALKKAEQSIERILDDVIPNWRQQPWASLWKT